MDWLLDINWRNAFVPDVAILKIVMRGTIVHLGLFFLLRVVLKRQNGGMGVTDLLVIVLIANASQKTMSAEYTSIQNGILLMGTIIFWSYTLDWLGYQFPRLVPVIYPQALQLVKDGRMLRRNMQREMITEAELMTQVRLRGVDNIEGRRSLP